MASQKYENEEFGEKRMSAEQQQQTMSSNLIHDYEMTDMPGVGSTSTASTPASSTTTATSSSTSSITPTSSCSSAVSSSSSTNLRDLENLVKQQQPSGGSGCKTVSSSSSSNNVVNPNNTSISPTTVNSTTNCDLRRTQHESEDPDYVSVPRICPGVNCPEKIVS